MGGLPPHAVATVLTVGSFDGVHLGHQALLRAVGERARARGAASALLTFAPHPLRVVRPEAAPALLAPAVEQREALAEFDLDYAAVVPFTRALSRYSPARFARDVLVGRLRAVELVVGSDHRFGRAGRGDVGALRRLGAALGFGVTALDPVREGGAVVSSTRIRAAVAAGDMEAAALALGRPYSIRGRVVGGLGRGRDLGFPTANLSRPPPEKLLPAEGIYVARARWGGDFRDGLLHLGPRPVYDDAPPSIELHLFDFDRDLRGERVSVDIWRRLRPVLPFPTEAELVAQMRRDEAVGRAFFDAL